MSIEAVLGNKEFELVVFGVTLAVVTRRSASGHGVSVLSDPWPYDSVVHQGYLCKFCELFCGHSSSSQESFTLGITLVHYDCYSITGPPNY
jgi:hypothetical protein